MIVTITDRQKKILQSLTSGVVLSRREIEEQTGESRINVIRELGKLVDMGYVSSHGAARAVTYGLAKGAQEIAIWDAKEYLAEEPDARGARYTSIEIGLFNKFDGSIGAVPSIVIAAASNRRRLGDDAVTAKKDLERFVIEMSWKSSKIEGNTYTLLDTERLLLDAEEAKGHDHNEAVMILNHKKAFDYIWQHRRSFQKVSLSMIEEVHQLLVTGLDVQFGLRASPVGITGTAYQPPASKAELSGYMRDAIDVINTLANPLEKAMACIVLIAYLQPFADGNKRTSRLMANAVLLAQEYPPLSYRSIDIEAYKGALILFYEQGVLANFRDLFVEQVKESALNYFFPTGE
jgi:Fic family protein